MKFYIVILIILLIPILSSSSFCQNLQKAFQLIDQEKFEEALKIFNQAQSLNKEVLATKYGFALVYSDDKYKKNNLAKAYRNITYLKEKYSNVDQKLKMSVHKYQINGESINSLYNKILTKTLENAKKLNTRESLEDFLTKFGDSKEAGEIWEDVFNMYLAQKDLYLLREFQQKFKNFPYVDQLWDNIYRTYTEDQLISTYKSFLKEFSTFPDKKRYWTDLFNLYTLDGDINTLTQFDNEFPNYPFKDTLTKYKAIANKGEILKLDTSIKDSQIKAVNEYIKLSAPRGQAFVALQRLIEKNIDKKDYKAVINTINNYLSFFKSNDKAIQNLLNLLKSKDEKIKIESIGKNVNTQGDEYVPFITADGKHLYFCGYRRKDNLGSEDIFVSEYSNKAWQKAKLLNGLNTIKGNEAPEAVSADNNQIILFKNGDLYYSDKTKNGWSNPIPYKGKKAEFWESNASFSPNEEMYDQNGINSQYWEGDAMLSSNGKTLIYCSDRPGGVGIFHAKDQYFNGSFHGNIDIYVSQKTQNGWSNPLNLGRIINTPYCERSPFLHPDMKTLYFSSEGHGGLGRLDVYKTTRLYDTSWLYWSKPENLGKEINTTKDDWGYKISTDGHQGYYAAFNKDNFDIFHFELTDNIRPSLVAIISGKITDSKGQPVESSIFWEDLETGKNLGESKSDPNDGSYFIILPLKKKYGYFASNQLYYPLSGNIDLTNKSTALHQIREIKLVSLEEMKKGESVPLKNIFFDFDKTELKPESFPELRRFLEFLRRNKDLKFEISGHTDNFGKDDYNKQLSEDRASAVRNYLINNGIETKRLESKGYGQTVPIASNDSEEGRALNRRVEVKVIY